MFAFEMISTCFLLLILYFVSRWFLREDAKKFFTVKLPKKEKETRKFKSMRKIYLQIINVITPIFLVFRILFVFVYYESSEPLEFYIGYIIAIVLTFILLEVVFIIKFIKLSKVEKWFNLK